MNKHSLAVLAIVKKYGHMVQNGARPTMDLEELRALFDYIIEAEITAVERSTK